jgi:nucleoside-diphosphate-sugar epimerase
MVGPSGGDNPMRAFYSGRTVCVTGGAGFIGGHLVEALVLLGARVAVIDDLSNSSGTLVASLAQQNRDQVRFVYGSILEPAALTAALADADTVFHLAALNSVPRSLEEPERTFEVNATGTLRVAEASRRAAVRRLVFAASSSAYGDDPALPKAESMLPRPISPYAASKLAGESIVRAWSHSYRLSGASLRYFNVFGPRQPAGDAYAAVVSAFLTKFLAGERPTIFGDGAQTRDFTPVANVVHATLLAGSATALNGEAINIALGRRTSVRELFDTLARLTDRLGTEPIFQDARRGDVPHSVADISLAQRLLGYTPVKSLTDGLADTAAAYSRPREDSVAAV